MPARPALLATLAGLAIALTPTHTHAGQPAPPAPASVTLPSLGPQLPDDAARESEAIQQTLNAQLARLIAEDADHDARTEALADAIASVQSIVSLRETHQGNEPDVRWRNISDAPTAWHELVTARARLADLEELRTLDPAGLDTWALARRQHDEAVSAARQGRLVDARNILLALFDEREARADLSPRRLDTLAQRRDLALIMQNLAQATDAEPRFRAVVMDYRIRLGEHHPTTLDALNTHALALNAMGEQDEASQGFDEVLRGRAHVLGAAHPATLVAALNTGFSALNNDRTAQALERFEEAYEGLRSALGEIDLTTLVAAESRGVALQRLGRLDDAEEMYLLVENGRRTALGPEHPDTLRAASNVATLHTMQDRLAEAAFRANVVAEGRRQQLGEGHPLYLASISDLADILERQGHHERAASFAARAHNAWRTTLGDQHPETLAALDRLARIRLAQGRAEEALGMLSGALRFRTEAGLTDTPAARASALARAHAQFMTGRESEAIIGLRVLTDEPDNADATGARRALATALLRTSDHHGAANAVRPLLGNDAPLRDRALAALAKRAPSDTLETLLRSSTEELGPDSHVTIALTHALAGVLHDVDPARAAELYARALEGALSSRPVRTLDDFAPSAMDVGADYTRLLVEQGRTTQAFDAVQRVRSHEAFDLLVRTASDRTVLRTQLSSEERATYEELLAREFDTRATAYEAELRADELRTLEGDPLTEARTAYTEATRSLLRFVHEHCTTLTPITSDALAERLADGRAYADIVATREALLVFWVTSAGVEGRVMSDDPRRIEELERLATRLRLLSLEPGAPNPFDTADLVTLRNGLLPTELRRLLGDRVTACAMGISEAFAYAPMALLVPDTALSRTPTAAGAFNDGSPHTPDRLLALTAEITERDARLEDAIASLAPDAFTRYDVASGTAQAMRSRIAEVAPTRLHVATPIWIDAQTSAALLPDYADAPASVDLIDTLGPRTNALSLVALPDARVHIPASGLPRPDTLGPVLTACGVRSALYPTWKSDPEATAMLLARFYANTEGRAGSGAMPAGAALLEAQRWLSMLTRSQIDAHDENLAALVTAPVDDEATGERPYAHPHYWAGFVLAGTPWGE